MGVQGVWTALHPQTTQPHQHSLWQAISRNGAWAVVVAPALAEARRMIDILVDHGDLPQDETPPILTACPPALARRLMRGAQEMGIGETVVAIVAGGIFLTEIGGL